MHDRYHSTDTREMFVHDWQNCSKNPGEPIFDYADRLNKLFTRSYLEGNTNLDQNQIIMRDRLLKDKVIQGLPSNLKRKVQNKDFNTWEELVQYTNKIAINMDEENKPNIHYIDAVVSKNDIIFDQMKQFSQTINKTI